MQSVLINTNLLIACKEDKVSKYFFSSSACAYNKTKQQEVFIDGLKRRGCLSCRSRGWIWVGKII